MYVLFARTSILYNHTQKMSRTKNYIYIICLYFNAGQSITLHISLPLLYITSKTFKFQHFNHPYTLIFPVGNNYSAMIYS